MSAKRVACLVTCRQLGKAREQVGGGHRAVTRDGAPGWKVRPVHVSRRQDAWEGEKESLKDFLLEGSTWLYTYFKEFSDCGEEKKWRGALETGTEG